MNMRIFPCLFITLLFGTGDPYFQQEVTYNIQVTLNDSDHTLKGHETLVYTNHSPDTLDFIWFHLWPNAYKNDETEFAKQKLKSGSTRFHFSREKDQGFIDSLDFSTQGKSLNWDYHPEWIDVAKIVLDNPLFPDSQVTIETPFFVKLPVVFSRLGHSGKHYEITQWYPKPAVYDPEGWHPLPYLDKGEFYSEFGTFDVTITLPEEYRIMATGDLVNGEGEYAWLDSLARETDKLHALEKKEFKKRIKALKKDQKKKKKSQDKIPLMAPKLKTLHFHQEDVHDFAWFADSNWLVRKGELWLADSSHKVILWSMYLPKNAQLWENSIEYLHDAGYWYSTFYGDYPYDHITAVDGDLSAGGGMEYPNITVISKSGSKDLLEFVIMHEVGHNWFYGILGSNERDHAWLDEGLNEYTNIRYWEKKYSNRGVSIVFSDKLQNKLGIAKHLDMRWVMHYFPYAFRAVSGDDQPIDLTSTSFNSSNYGIMIYMKTAVFTRYLQYVLGDEKMNEIMQDYYKSWKFRHPQPEDLRASFARHTDKDLSWYFDDSINDTKKIDYAVHRSGSRLTLENHGTMKPPILVAFYNREGKEIERRWVEGFDGRITINEPENSVRVKIDPDKYLPDINPMNNSCSHPLQFHLVFDQPDYFYRDASWLPSIGWNTYNSAAPGFILYSGYIPPYRYGWTLNPMWDFRHNQVIGSIKVQKKYYQLLGFRSVTLSGSLARSSGRQGGAISFSGIRRKPVISFPSTKMTTRWIYHDLNQEALDTVFYSGGQFSNIELKLENFRKRVPFFSSYASVGFKVGMAHSDFVQVEAQGKATYRFTKKLSVIVRGWVGSFLVDSDIPKQYRTWMGGSVDPDFDNQAILNRMGNEGKGWLPVYERQFIPGGPGLRGRMSAPVSSGKTAWGINLDLLPGFFMDFAGRTEEPNKVYVDAGIRIPLSTVKIFIPFYQSWDDQPVLDGLDWVRDRIRMEIDFKFFNIRI